ncbi:MAG: phosphotriesterase-related protein [Dehalococcoidia bacterium]|nr:phosphotriesterase-related protein [Dehalococcoidia bacterium]
MTEVNTVLGPIPVSQLGRVLMHEHLVLFKEGWELDARNNHDRERDLESVSRQLAVLPEYGVKTIVDATVIEHGRDVAFMAEASKRSGVRIIASTGLLNEESGFPSYFRLRGIDEIAAWMVWELTEGMRGTSVRAGVIKVATGLGRIGLHEEKALRAAARAHKRTGAPILTHTDGGTMGKEQVDIFEEEGADLSRVIIGHSCGNSDLCYHFDILKRGANVGLDRIGYGVFMPDEIRRGVAMSAIAAGYASQVMLSQDMTSQYYGASPELVKAIENRGQLGYEYIMTDFIPKLREAGVSERSIEACLVDLPRRFLGY